MKDGEYKCFECNGSGKVGEYTFTLKNKLCQECITDIICPVCHGSGVLDWISNIIKPKRKNDTVNIEQKKSEKLN